MNGSEKLKGRGKSLYLAVSLSPLSNKEIAVKAGYKENTYYSHIKQENLKFDTLARYGKVLKYDFSIEYHEMQDYENIQTSAELKSISGEKEHELLLKKYVSLLEKHTGLLESYQNLQKRLLESVQKLP